MFVVNPGSSELGSGPYATHRIAVRKIVQGRSTAPKDAVVIATCFSSKARKDDGRYYTVLEGGIQKMIVQDESFMEAQIEAASKE
ncbi:hypothetical protein QJS10_CPA03g02187 [Acorus calamus]|uniref:Uncharacterized protein n=1 Tax=Acorus calamus TaxID=4465 RepID=A0AAV9FD53_ACOCL|nr:hypothetical protein QJS10_CPA03g02187 [Acorus calamus]